MVSIHIDLPEDLRTRAAQAAESRGVSLEDFVRECVRDRLSSVADDPFLGDSEVFEEPMPEASAEHIEYMRRGLEEAELEIAEGRGVPFDLDEIKRMGREKLEQRKKLG